MLRILSPGRSPDKCVLSGERMDARKQVDWAVSGVARLAARQKGMTMIWWWPWF